MRIAFWGTLLHMLKSIKVFQITILTKFRIRIHRIHMFLVLPDPDPLVGGMDPDMASDPDPSIIKQK